MYSLLLQPHPLPSADEPRRSVGKVSYSTMSDQMRMEYLVSGFHSTEHFEATPGCFEKYFCTPTAEFDGVCEWFEVSCDENDNVEAVNWAKRTPLHDFQGGSIELTWIPPFVTDFDLRWQGMSGSIDTESLPHALVAMYLGGNKFHGTIDLCHLPPKLDVFSIPRNEIEGPIDLGALPEGLTQLSLHKNKIFQEEVDVSKLPEATIRVLLTGNYIDKLCDENGEVDGHRCVRIDPLRPGQGGMM